MMTKRLYIALIAGLVATLSLTGCGSSSDESDAKIDIQKAREEAKRAIDESNMEEEAEKLMREIESDQ